MPVRALQQRTAVLMSTEESLSGCGPSKEGDQCPPIAIASSLPFIPTKNCTRKQITRTIKPEPLTQNTKHAKKERNLFLKKLK